MKEVSYATHGIIQLPPDSQPTRDSEMPRKERIVGCIRDHRYHYLNEWTLHADAEKLVHIEWDNF